MKTRLKMKTGLKTSKILVLFLFILSYSHAIGQISIVDLSTKKEISGNELDYAATPGYGIEIPIAAIKEFDRIDVGIYYRDKGSEDKFYQASSIYFYVETWSYYPTSEAFKVTYKNKDKISLILYDGDDSNRERFFSAYYYKSYKNMKSILSREYLIQLQGYVQTGTEDYWDGNVLRERGVYTFSELITESSAFSFTCNIPEEKALGSFGF